MLIKTVQFNILLQMLAHTASSLSHACQTHATRGEGVLGSRHGNGLTFPCSSNGPVSTPPKPARRCVQRYQYQLKMNRTSKNIPYHETKKAKAEKVRLQTWNQHIDAIKSLMIERGIGTEKELSSQEKVLFKVVQSVTSEDLLSNYPPLKFTGNETASDKHTAREKYRRGKQDAALGKIKNFILGAGIGKWRNTKTDLERVEVLKLILEHIQNSGITSSTAVTSPVSSPASNNPVPACNASTANQGDILPSAGSLPSSSQSQLSNIRSFPVVSPFLWNNSLPEILSSAMFVPVVPSLPAYNLYNSALHCYTLNRFMRDVSISVPTRESLKVDENDKSEEEDVIIDIVGNANEKSTNNDKEDEELDIIN